MRKTIQYLAAALLLAGSIYAFPTRCPFVDEASGLPCMGLPHAAGSTPNGYIYECSFGHRWVETN